MAYAMGFAFGIDNDLIYDFLLGVGDAVNATGLEVVKKKIKAKIKRNKLYVVKIKVKLEDGTTLKFKHKQVIKTTMRLVQVDPKQFEEDGNVDAAEEVLKQLEAAMGGKAGKKEEENKKQIGFKLD